MEIRGLHNCCSRRRSCLSDAGAEHQKLYSNLPCACVSRNTAGPTVTTPTEEQAGPGQRSAGGPCLERFHFLEGDLVTNSKSLKRMITAVMFSYMSPYRGRLDKSVDSRPVGCRRAR